MSKIYCAHIDAILGSKLILYMMKGVIGPRLKSGKGLWNGLRFTMKRR